MDIRDLTFDDGTFDVAIDQGRRLAFQTVAPLGSHMHIRIGTMDAMMTAKGDVWVRFTVLQHHVRDPPSLPTGLSATDHIIDDCTREVDEVLPFDHYHLFNLAVAWFSRFRTFRVLRKGNDMFLYLTSASHISVDGI